jgi:glutamyl-tRNA synthetase
MREEQKARKEAPRYDNRHRNLTPEQKAEFEAQGRKAVIRFKIDDDREIVWQDLIRGTVTWKGSDLGGDMVIARAAENAQEAFGQPLYNLAVVIDDIDMQITHVIRGEDHIANTAKQILLYEAFGAKVPEFAHTPLILNQEGRKLSKRDGVTSIDDFKKMGFVKEAMANYMTLLGWTPPDGEEIFTLAQAAAQFDIGRVNRAGAKFDWAKLDWINSQYLHKMPLGELLELLIPYWQGAGYDIDTVGDRAWLEQLTTMIAPSLTRLTDALPESRLLFGATREFSEDAIAQLKQGGVREIIQEVVKALEEKPRLTATDAQEIISQITKTQKVKKGVVMKSLRAALMGELSGPDLLQSWLLLNQKGWDKSRLQKALEL